MAQLQQNIPQPIQSDENHLKTHIGCYGRFCSDRDGEESLRGCY